MRRTVVRSLGLAVVALALAACSSSEPEPGTAQASITETMTVPASAETKSELGVEVWGAEARDGGGLHMTGYGTDGQVAFVVDQRTILTDDTHHTFETTVGGRETAVMHLDGTVGAVDSTGHFEIALDMSKNSFPESPLATKVLQLAQKDLEGTADASSGTSLLAPAALQPMTAGSLVSTCAPLVKSCAGSLVRAGAPLVPCVMAAVQTGSVLLCAAAGGAVAGPVGALEAGAVCGIRQQGALVKNGMECADRARGIYENWKSRVSDVVSSCKSAASGCTGGSSSGSSAATSSFAVSLDAP